MRENEVAKISPVDRQRYFKSRKKTARGRSRKRTVRRHGECAGHLRMPAQADSRESRLERVVSRKMRKRKMRKRKKWRERTSQPILCVRFPKVMGMESREGAKEESDARE